MTDGFESISNVLVESAERIEVARDRKMEAFLHVIRDVPLPLL